MLCAERRTLTVERTLNSAPHDFVHIDRKEKAVTLEERDASPRSGCFPEDQRSVKKAKRDLLRDGGTQSELAGYGEEKTEEEEGEQ